MHTLPRRYRNLTFFIDFRSANTLLYSSVRRAHGANVNVQRTVEIRYFLLRKQRHEMPVFNNKCFYKLPRTRRGPPKTMAIHRFRSVLIAAPKQLSLRVIYGAPFSAFFALLPREPRECSCNNHCLPAERVPRLACKQYKPNCSHGSCTRCRHTMTRIKSRSLVTFVTYSLQNATGRDGPKTSTTNSYDSRKVSTRFLNVNNYALQISISVGFFFFNSFLWISTPFLIISIKCITDHN